MNGLKKKTLKLFIKDKADLNIYGVRKSEKGIRASSYKNCYSIHDGSQYDDFRPLFWITDRDKIEYEQEYSIEHSRCYTQYGLKRTGCTGCPYSLHLKEELEIMIRFEPKLYSAAVNIFWKSYEYTIKYREFAKKMKANEKEEKAQCEGQLRIL